MKAIVRNVLLACLISTFAFFGAIGRRPHFKKIGNTEVVVKPTTAQDAESRKETLTCLGVGFLAWVLCFWRCGAINRRLNEEREYQERFNEYMRNKAFHRQY
jgi:hypothetical protein